MFILTLLFRMLLLLQFGDYITVVLIHLRSHCHVYVMTMSIASLKYIQYKYDAIYILYTLILYYYYCTLFHY